MEGYQKETWKENVAVLLPVYVNDRPGWYRKALQSILHQTYGHEHIHVYLGIDGPLKEGLESEIRVEAGILYKIVRNEEKLGLNAILNRLIETLEDESFVFRMDADDIAFKDRFEAQVSFLKSHLDVEILGTALIEIDEEGHELFKRTFPKSNADVLHYIHKASPLAHPTVCFRRSALDALGAYPVGKCRCEDLALWFDCIEKGFSICNLDNPLLYLRVTDSLYKRRRAAAVAELLIYWKGILRTQGFSWRLVYPLLRFLFRLAPLSIVRRVYSGRLRLFLNR